MSVEEKPEMSLAKQCASCGFVIVSLCVGILFNVENSIGLVTRLCKGVKLTKWASYMGCWAIYTTLKLSVTFFKFPLIQWFSKWSQGSPANVIASKSFEPLKTYFILRIINKKADLRAHMSHCMLCELVDIDKIVEKIFHTNLLGVSDTKPVQMGVHSHNIEGRRWHHAPQNTVVNRHLKSYRMIPNTPPTLMIWPQMKDCFQIY